MASLRLGPAVTWSYTKILANVAAITGVYSQLAGERPRRLIPRVSSTWFEELAYYIPITLSWEQGDGTGSPQVQVSVLGGRGKAAHRLGAAMLLADFVV